MKMYRASIWQSKILSYNILKRTLKSVEYIKGNNNYSTRELLETREHAWFEHLDEAIEWKKQKILFDIDFFQQKVDYQKRKLSHFIKSLSNEN